MATWEAVMSGSSGRIYLVLQVDVVSQNIAANTSTLNWYVRLEERSTSTAFNLSHVYTGTAAVNGAVWSAGGLDYDFRPGSPPYNYNYASGTTTVTHNGDGTKTIAVSAGFNGSGAYGSANLSNTFALPTIPRASTPTFSANPSDIGTALTITTNRADAGFTHTLYYNFEGNGWSAAFATGVGASTSWTPPTALMDLIPNAASGTCQIWTDTWSGGTLIGTTITSITLTVPASEVPSFGTITCAEATTSPNVASLVGGYVQNISTFSIVIPVATATHSATIASYRIDVAGQSIAGRTGTTAPINASGTVTITGTAIDSRGRQTQHTLNVTVLAYAPPTYTAPLFRRANSGTGALDAENGTAIRMDLVANCSSLIVSTQKNALYYDVFIRAKGAGSWGTAVDTVSVGAITFNSFDYWATYSLSSAWEIRVEIRDKLSPAIAVEGTVATASIFMHWGGVGQGMGVNKYWEQGALDVRGKIYQDNLMVLDTSAIPPGTSWEFSGITAPTGWLLEDGTSELRATYAALFAAVSQTFTGATTTNTSTTVSGLSGMSAAAHVGWGISAPGLPANATIVSVTNATTVVISGASTTTATARRLW